MFDSLGFARNRCYSPRGAFVRHLSRTFWHDFPAVRCATARRSETETGSVR